MSYREKYLKYKIKYIDFKNKLFGGTPGIEDLTPAQEAVLKPETRKVLLEGTQEQKDLIVLGIQKLKKVKLDGEQRALNSVHVTDKTISAINDEIKNLNKSINKFKSIPNDKYKEKDYDTFVDEINKIITKIDDKILGPSVEKNLIHILKDNEDLINEGDLSIHENRQKLMEIPPVKRTK